MSFTLTTGEVLCLKGESGSGKSTMISLAAGLQTANSGTVSVLDRSLSTMPENERDEFRLRNIGVVFQDHNLVPQFTAKENVLLVLRCQGNDAPDEAMRLLDSVGIADLAERRAWEMSGGQRQRIGIARALAGQRKLLLCDEPTGSLDRVNADRIYALLRSIAQREEVGVVIASHDPVASEISDKTITLDSGRIVGEA
ncbi:MAG: ABC transporter ATP-binding protein [Arachnia sp.]